MIYLIAKELADIKLLGKVKTGGILGSIEDLKLEQGLDIRSVAAGLSKEKVYFTCPGRSFSA